MSALLTELATALSGQGAHDLADNLYPSMENPVEAIASANSLSLAETVKKAVELIGQAVDMTGEAFGQAVELASDKAFQGAAEPGAGSQILGQSSFSWGGYFQAIGILCLLLAVLWLAVWLLRRYGKFNFLPRPGSLPQDALVMEAQMPLGPRKGLMVVRFLHKRLLLAVTDQSISLIAEEKAQDGRHEQNFRNIMEEARNAGSDSGIGGPSA